MAEVGKAPESVLESYAGFLRDRGLAPPQAPTTPGKMRAGVPAIR